MENLLKLEKWYVRIIAVFFVLVSLTLAVDYVRFGLRAETIHKLFHIVIGAAVIWWGWNNYLWWKYFPLVNGLFFSCVALVGWVFPDLGGLDAFNRADTILHSVVGISGLIVGFMIFKTKKPF